MVQVTSFDPEGLPFVSKALKATSDDILHALSLIQHPHGDGLVHFKVGRAKPVPVRIHRSEIAEAQAGGAIGGIAGALLNMIPVVGPLLGGLFGSGAQAKRASRKPSQWNLYVKANYDRIKSQHPDMTLGEVTRILSKEYHSRQ
jgi:hypothetical protein